MVHNGEIKHILMKKLISFLILTTCLLPSILLAQSNSVKVELVDGIYDPALKSKIESNASKLLTAINNAFARNSNVNYTGIVIDRMATQTIGMSWNHLRFCTLDNEIVEDCYKIERINRKSGSREVLNYQIRNIMVQITPLDASYDSGKLREVCLDFDRNGKIIDFNFAMDKVSYANLLKEGNRLNDTDRRLQIISWCEKFKNAYNTKDKDFMQMIFSEDALIITGKVIQPAKFKSEVQISPAKVELVTKTKKQYLTKLFQAFDNRNNYINVEFTDYEILRHGAKPNYYFVTLVQNWHSSIYSDTGNLSLVWDFTDDDNPKIQVRAWTPISAGALGVNDIKLP